MKRVMVYDEEITREKINERFFEECKNVMCERMGEHRIKVWLPGLCKLEVVDTDVDFYDMSREILNIYKNKIIDERKEIYLNKYKI